MLPDKLPPIEDVKRYIKMREEDPKLQAILKFTIAKDREEKYNRIMFVLVWFLNFLRIARAKASNFLIMERMKNRMLTEAPKPELPPMVSSCCI